jgi:crotonobetainyl-CoA:carnitine CoA-transferase CaiB-like acyl-CoA transferase
MAGEDPEWWSNKHTEDEWKAICDAQKLIRDTINKIEWAAEKEKRARREAWRELRNSMTVEEADAYIFNLTKLGTTKKAVAQSLGMTSVSQYLRRYKERNNVG